MTRDMYKWYYNTMLGIFGIFMNTMFFGEELEGTDSGRVWGYGTSEAMTPRPSGGAYLRAYCGD